MEESISSLRQYLFSFFAMLITLLSFVLLSLQITFISILWFFSSFINHLLENIKLTKHHFK